MHYAELKRARAELTGPGGPFEVIESEVLGETLLTYRNQPTSVRDFWLASAAYAERPCLIYGDETLSYAQVHAQVAAIAAWLWVQGLRPGDRVAIAMRNYPEWLPVYWAAACIGVASVGMNAWWTPEEMDYALKDSAPRVLFADAERLERFRQIDAPDPALQLVGVRLPDCPPDVIPWAKVVASAGALPEVEIHPDSDCSIFYTSGTTGFPKGARLTHRGCVANTMNLLYSAASSALAVERATGQAPPAPPPPVTLVTTPMFHVTANNCAAYAAAALGGALVLMYRWDAGEALRLIARHRCTGMSGVPVMAREVINHPDFAGTDTSSLLALSGGGAKVPPDQVLEIEAKVPSARPTTGYGMTETSGIITSLGGDFYVDRPASAGPWMPNFRVKCVDDDGNEVPLGERGELWVKGSSVFKGYLNRPEATAAAITEGWLHTGDIAVLDADGFVEIVDRKKDIVIRGGENVSCSEVEAALYRHPAVAECCVFGVADDRLGEEIGAAVVLKTGSLAKAEDLRAVCGEGLARHKVPRFVWVLDEALPRNASGKFLRRELQERLSGEPSG